MERSQQSGFVWLGGSLPVPRDTCNGGLCHSPRQEHIQPTVRGASQELKLCQNGAICITAALDHLSSAGRRLTSVGTYRLPGNLGFAYTSFSHLCLGSPSLTQSFLLSPLAHDRSPPPLSPPPPPPSPLLPKVRSDRFHRSSMSRPHGRGRTVRARARACVCVYGVLLAKKR